MIEKNLPVRLGFFGLLGSLLWSISGCGGDEFGRCYRVSGRVTREGLPLTRGTVNYLPVDARKGHPATGEIQPDGTYMLTTKDPGDGALVGDYRVTIDLVDVEDSRLERMPGGIPRLDPPNTVQVNSLVPPKFSDPNLTVLKAKVESHSNTVDFDLTGLTSPSDEGSGVP
jgi:hypothetical protein